MGFRWLGVIRGALPLLQGGATLAAVNGMQLARAVVRWVATGAAAVVAALYANSAAYSAWLSGGPPTPVPAAWLHRAFAHACFAGAALALAAVMFMLLGRRRRARAALLFAALAVLLVLLPRARVFLLADRCLDAGGSFDAVTFACRR